MRDALWVDRHKAEFLHDGLRVGAHDPVQVILDFGLDLTGGVYIQVASDRV